MTGGLLPLITSAARAAVLADFQAEGSCIASTAVVIETCRYFGIQARPEPVAFTVWNAAGWAAASAELPYDDWPDGAHCLGIFAGHVTTPDRWNGHLVAVTREHLIDASLDMASRPEYGIVLHPAVIALPVPGEGVPAGGFVAARPGGTVIAYRHLDEDPTWRQSPNLSLRRCPELRAAAATAIRVVRAASPAGRL